MIEPLNIGQKVDIPEKIAATQNLPANAKMMAAEINAIPAKINELVTAVNNSGNSSGKLTGTLATDAETQITAGVEEDNKFVSRVKLFNWWAKIKTLATTITGIWNFANGAKIGGENIATVADIALLSQAFRHYSLVFGQLNPNNYPSFNAKVQIIDIQLVRGINSISEYQVLLPTGLGAVRTTLAAVNSDISALTVDQTLQGYSVRVRAVITPGESVGMAILKSQVV